MNITGNLALAAVSLLAWTAKATVMLGLAWLAAVCLRSGSAAVRHRVWVIAIVSSLALPLVSPAVPAWHLFSRPPIATQTLSPSTLNVESAVLPSPTVQPEQDFDIERLIGLGFAIWALGTVFVAFRLLAGLGRLWRISTYSTTASEDARATLDELRATFGITRRVRLLESASATMMPMTWGVFHPRVVLPSGATGWDDGRRRIVFSHELAHVLRNDWLLQFCAEVLRACFWFHPLAWIAARRMRQESERACDDAVLNSGIDAQDYASQLLALAQTLKASSWRFSLALAIARPSNLERRFAAMLNSSIRRTPVSRTVNLIAISFAACLLLSLAALTLSAEAPSSPQSPTAPQSAPLAANRTPSTGEGSISGTVVDQRGMGILGATVTLTGRSTRLEQKTATGPSGTFVFSKLVPGTYAVKIGRPGLNISPSRIIFVVLRDDAKTATIRLALSNFGAALPGRSVQSGEPGAAETATPAQGTTSGPIGSISGSVGDPSGAMVPRANVTLTEVATGQQQQITANAAGEFNFSNLIPDGYELSIEQPGFRIYKQTIQLYPSEQLKLPELLLSVGQVEQTVSVSATRIGARAPQMPSALAGSVMGCSGQTARAVQPTFKNPVEPGPAPRRIRVGGMVEVARLIQQTLPIYPESARAAGVRGTVVFNTVIGKDGSLLSPCVVNSQVDPALVQSAITAISQWRYSPGLLNGEPIEVSTEIAVVYTLAN